MNSDEKQLRGGRVRSRLVVLAVVGGLAVGHVAPSPASASWANSCRKTVTVTTPAANQVKVQVSPVAGCYDVEDYQGGGVGVPFAGEWVSLKKNTGSFDNPNITDIERVTKADGSTEITYAWTANDVITARACNYPPGAGSVAPYCEDSPATTVPTP